MEMLNTFLQQNASVPDGLIGLLRYVVPALSLLLLLRCVIPLLTFRREPEIWAWLNFADGNQVDRKSVV